MGGEIIQRFEKKGYKLVGLKVVKPTKQFAEQHYADLSKKPFFPSLVNYFSSGPVVAMVFEGRNAIVNGRKIVGATNPADAEAGSVRGDLCIDIGATSSTAPTAPRAPRTRSPSGSRRASSPTGSPRTPSGCTRSSKRVSSSFATFECVSTPPLGSCVRGLAHSLMSQPLSSALATT